MYARALSRVALLVNPNTEVAPLYKRVTEAVKTDMQAESVNGKGLVYQQRANVAPPFAFLLASSSVCMPARKRF